MFQLNARFVYLFANFYPPRQKARSTFEAKLPVPRFENEVDCFSISPCKHW